MSKNRNKNKGNNYELKIIKDLKSMNFSAVTSRSESKNMDDKGVDIVSPDFPYYIQCKSTVKIPSLTYLTEPTLTDKPFIILWNKQKKVNINFKSEGEFVIMKKEDFYKLIQQTHE